MTKTISIVEVLRNAYDAADAATLFAALCDACNDKSKTPEEKVAAFRAAVESRGLPQQHGALSAAAQCAQRRRAIAGNARVRDDFPLSPEEAAQRLQPRAVCDITATDVEVLCCAANPVEMALARFFERRHRNFVEHVLNRVDLAK